MGTTLLPFDGFVSAALVSSFLSLVTVIGVRFDLIEVMSPGKSWFLYLASLSPVLGALFISILSSNQWSSIDTFNYRDWLVFILWIPIVEEIFFRLGLGRFLRKVAGDKLAVYGTALAFAMLHSGLIAFDFESVGVPLGPFLLSVACEILFIKTGRLCYSILFHMSCNSTVLVFTAWDARWLEWLNFLYIS